MKVSAIDLSQTSSLAPALWTAVTGLAVLLADTLIKFRSKIPLAYITLTGLGIALAIMMQSWPGASEKFYLAGTVSLSSFALIAGVGIIVATGLASLSASQYARGSAVATGEFHGLLLFAATGALVMVAANDLVTLFVALETLSLSVYSLTGISRGRASSAEGAMKYFLLGAVASAFLLYGIGMVYGAAGTVTLFSDSGALAISTPGQGLSGPLAVSGVFCMLVAMLFKVGAVPFHAWLPDAYQGAPAPTTGFMSVVVKAAAFVALFKLVTAFGLGAGAPVGLRGLLFGIAALSMILGNFGALLQDDPKRTLAYSAIAHTGYALVAVVAAAASLETGRDLATLKECAGGLLFYVFAYSFSNLAIFAVLCSLERDGQDVRRINDLSGLSERSPLAAFAMMVGVLSLAGIPLTGGFLGKLWVFQAGLRAQQLGLVILGLLTSVVSLYFYLRIIVVMYMKPASESRILSPSLGQEEPSPAGRWATRLAMTVAALGTLALGIMPGHVSALVEQGAKSLFSSL